MAAPLGEAHLCSGHLAGEALDCLRGSLIVALSLRRRQAQYPAGVTP